MICLANHATSTNGQLPDRCGAAMVGTSVQVEQPHVCLPVEVILNMEPTARARVLMGALSSKGPKVRLNEEHAAVPRFASHTRGIHYPPAGPPPPHAKSAACNGACRGQWRWFEARSNVAGRSPAHGTRGHRKAPRRSIRVTVPA